MPGVVRTRVGYAGGTTENPTYYNLGDHTESIQIEYDPAVISYEELLDVFWASHDPFRQPWSRQYMAIVFTHDDEQERQAIEGRDRLAAGMGQKVTTEIVPFSRFYLAEDYHQKYRLQQDPVLVREFRAIYPSTQDFVDSTAAARVNGYVAGYGSLEMLRDELDSLGLSTGGRERLWDVVSSLHPDEKVEQCPLPSTGG
jgi:peptide-methionine (S)-S-oxide reductase